MVPKQAGYFGIPFKAERGVRQGDILSPMIFNLMVDAIVRHMEHLGVVNIQFYADDGLIWGEDGAIVQAQLNIISQSFATIGLKMNARKTEFLVMTGRLPTITISDRAFERRLGGGGPSHTDCANEKITCPICGAVRVRRALARHQDSAACQEARAELARQNVVIPSLLDARLISTPLERPPETFELSTLVGGAHYLCPVVGCPFSTQKRWQLNNHFRQRHPRDTLLWDDTVPHICEICGFRAMSARGLSLHRNSATCKRLAARNTALEHREIQIQASEFILTVDGNHIQKVKEFKYLGRIVSENDDDKPAIRRNIKRARQQ